MTKYQLQKLNNFFTEDSAKGAFWIIFASYVLYQILVFMNYRAMLPDELWFTGEAKKFNLFERKSPPLDYGSIYWFMLKILCKDYFIRAFSLILFLSIPFVISLTFDRYSLKLLCLLLYLSFPYAFWTGKLVGPEIYTVAAVTFSLFFMAKEKIKLSGIFAGIAVGIKITSLPIIAFIILAMPNKNKFIQKSFLIGIFFIIGMFLANPMNLDLYLTNLFVSNNKSSQPSFDYQRMINIMYTEVWSWDNVLANSFSQMICSPTIYMIYIAIIFLGSFALGSALMFFSLLTAYIVYSSKYALVWYWFALIPVVLYSLQSIKNYEFILDFRRFPKLIKDSKNILYFIKKYILILTITLLAICNFVINIPFSIFQANQKFEQIHLLNNYPKDCIIKSIKGYNPEIIGDKIEFGIHLYDIENKINIFPDLRDIPDINTKRAMIFIGKRMLANSYGLAGIIPKDYAVKQYGICGDVFIFVNK